MQPQPRPPYIDPAPVVSQQETRFRFSLTADMAADLRVVLLECGKQWARMARELDVETAPSCNAGDVCRRYAHLARVLRVKLRPKKGS